MKRLKDIIFGHVGFCIILLCIVPFLFVGHRFLRGVKGMEMNGAEIRQGAVDRTFFNLGMIPEVGRSIFLTREETEVALRR